MLRQIYDVWKSIGRTAFKRAFVGADVSVRPQNGPILWEFYANLQHSHGRQGRRPLHAKTEIAHEFAASLRENTAFRAGGQRRPPLQRVPQDFL